MLTVRRMLMTEMELRLKRTEIECREKTENIIGTAVNSTISLVLDPAFTNGEAGNGSQPLQSGEMVQKIIFSYPVL